MLPIPHHYQTKRTTGYELTGRIDVITSLALNNPAHRSNMLVQYILAALNEEVAQGRLRKLPQDFDVIINYKAPGGLL
jgi:hypothetical protein